MGNHFMNNEEWNNKDDSMLYGRRAMSNERSITSNITKTTCCHFLLSCLL